MATTYDKASLVMIPSGYKDDKLYSIKPTDGSGDFTFSRDGAGASPATRVNASGYIEKGRTNYLLQSNTFDTTWTLKKTGSNGLPVITGGFSDPDGGSNAWRFEVTAPTADNDYSVISQTPSFSGSNGTPFVQSIYVKANGAGQVGKFFDVYAYQPSSSSYRSVQNFELTADWQRVELLHTFNASGTSMEIVFGKARSSAGGSTLADMATDVLIYQSQLEYGLVATAPAIETTTAAVSAGLLGDMPRLDYSGGATCPSLLLEPSRVNVITSSEHLGSYSVSNVSVSYNNATSPEGVQNATLVTGDAGTLTKVVNFNPASNGAYTISVFAKYNTHQWIQLGMGGVATYANFDIQNGVVGGTNGTSDIEDYGNGWYRCSVQTTTGTPLSHYIGMVDSGTAARLATSTSTGSFWAYGMQSEIGSYPTSYIPTYGSASTRGQDSGQITSASAIIGQTEGTIFLQVGDFPQEFNGRIFAITQNSSNYITILKSGNYNDFYTLCAVGGSSQMSYQGTGSLSDNAKIAVAYANNDFVVYVNGTQVHTDTSGSVPTCSNIFIGKRENGTLTYATGGSVKQSVLFPTRLTNAELAALTA